MCCEHWTRSRKKVLWKPIPSENGENKLWTLNPLEKNRNRALKINSFWKFRKKMCFEHWTRSKKTSFLETNSFGKCGKNMLWTLNLFERNRTCALTINSFGTCRKTVPWNQVLWTTKTNILRTLNPLEIIEKLCFENQFLWSMSTEDVRWNQTPLERRCALKSFPLKHIENYVLWTLKALEIVERRCTLNIISFGKM